MPIIELKHGIGGLVTKFGSAVGIDVVHHKPDLRRRVFADVSSLRDYPSDQLVVHLAGPFLVRGGRVTIKDMGSAVPVLIEFKCHGVREFRAVICQEDREKLLVCFMPQNLVEVIENIGHGF